MMEIIAAALATAREEGRRAGYAEGFKDGEPSGMSWKEATTGMEESR
jgi:flagellar biosynthesis/type III secretory pathway protein FliH